MAPLKARQVDLEDIPWTEFALEHTPSGVPRPPTGAPLRSERPSAVPWTQFEGNPELGQVRFLHIGAESYPIRSDGYLREVAVWPNGVVWFEDYGLRFVDRDGEVVRVEGVPAWYGRLTYGPAGLYFIKSGALMSLAARDLTPRTEATLAEIAGVDRGLAVRGYVLGLLGPDDPLLSVTYRTDDGSVTRLHSLRRGPMPLSSEWDYVTSPVGRVLLALDGRRRTLAAFRSSDLRPLWTREFSVGRRPLRLEPPKFTPSGRRVVLSIGSSGNRLVVLNAATGKVEHALRMRPVGAVFEDDSHFIYAAYDGPPNPGFDPRDTFPEVSEIDAPNLLVRCSLRKICELVARVDPPEQSLVIGDTFLFPGP